MKSYLYIYSILFLLPFKQTVQAQVGSGSSTGHTKVVIPEHGVKGNMVTARWKNAIESRLTAERFDSISRLARSLSAEENKWIDLIKSRSGEWNLYRDSLAVPFGGSKVPDTVYVLMGSFGYDDAFTFQFNTVCFDLTALH